MYRNHLRDQLRQYWRPEAFHLSTVGEDDESAGSSSGIDSLPLRACGARCPRETEQGAVAGASSECRVVGAAAEVGCLDPTMGSSAAGATDVRGPLVHLTRAVPSTPTTPRRRLAQLGRRKARKAGGVLKRPDLEVALRGSRHFRSMTTTCVIKIAFDLPCALKR